MGCGCYCLSEHSLAAGRLHVIYINVVIPGKTGKYTPCQFCNSRSATLVASRSVILIEGLRERTE